MEMVVFDEHHEALLFWEKAVSCGWLRKGATLVHVDGHSDLGIPHHLTESVYSTDVKGFTQRQLHIGNFIIPAVMKGIFKEVIFLCRSGDPQKRKKHRTGSLFGKGLWIKDHLAKDKLTMRLYPDAKEWHYSIVTSLQNIRARNVALDIDLDYFYGYLYPIPQFKLRLTKRQIRHIRKTSLSEDIYKIDLKPFSSKGGFLIPGMAENFKKIIFNGSMEWIECAVKSFTESIMFNPQVISICRSVKTGYTPGRYARQLEGTLVQYLSHRKNNTIDPCDIKMPFAIYPHIVDMNNMIYNPLTDDIIRLNPDSRFIWLRIKKRMNFSQIFADMCDQYDLPPNSLKAGLLKFILNLKYNLVVR